MSESIIRVALAGFGASARTFHLPFFLSRPDQFQVTCVLDRKGVDAPRLLPDARVHADIGSLVADSHFDLAIITLPNDMHASAAIAILDSGRSVVVEKPLTVTEAEGNALLAAEARSGKTAFVYHNRRLDGDFLLVQELLQSQRLGRLVRAEVRIERWANALRKKAWKERGAAGSTLLEDLGSHFLDQALVLFGLPQSLQCRLGIQRDQSQTVDAFRMSLEYPGLWVDLEAGMVTRQSAFHWALHGTAGSFLKRGVDPQEAQLAAGVSPLAEGLGVEAPENAGTFYPSEGEAVVLQTPPGRYGAFYDDVWKTLREGAVTAFPASGGLTVVKLLEAARTSAELAQTIRIS